MLALDAILSTALVHITPHCGAGVLFDNMAFISQPNPNMAPSKTHWLHENLNHVFQCSQAASTRKSAWAQFLSTLQKTSTYPLFVETLGYGISHWSTGSLPQWQAPNQGLSDTLRLLVLTVFQEQQSIGWDQAIRGHLSVHWGKQTHCIARSNYTRATSPLTVCGPLALFKEWGSMELINGWVRMSSSVERPKKISVQSRAKKRKENTRGTWPHCDHVPDRSTESKTQWLTCLSHALRIKTGTINQ